MASFFIVENDVIVNVIVADTKEIAEQVTGLLAIDSENPTVANASRGAVFDAEQNLYINPQVTEQ
tara:strand:- start:599 stop:793 length:195 start_codon:yes stop_codon:yes gene_type:complete